MSRRTSRRSVDDDAVTCAANSEAAMEAYLDGGGTEELLRASASVLGSSMRLDEEHAGIIAALTGCSCALEDYDDAAPRRAALVRPDGGAGC
jgi:hypothetical protein